jgi:hypothetical protein
LGDLVSIGQDLKAKTQSRAKARGGKMHRMHQLGLWPVLLNIFPMGITKLKMMMRTTNPWKGWNSCIRFSGERLEAAYHTRLGRGRRSTTGHKSGQAGKIRGYAEPDFGL